MALSRALGSASLVALADGDASGAAAPAAESAEIDDRAGSVVDAANSRLLLAAALPESVRWLGWLLAVLLPLASVLRQVEGGFSIRPAHFAERHRLMLIIALGESVLAIGRSAQEHLTEPAYLAAVLLAMVLISLLWWVHFADDVALGRVERVVERPDGVTARTALYAFSLGYLVLVAGLILVAAGVHVAVHDPGHQLAWRAALTMSAGAAVYLVGNVFYLARLGVHGRRWLAVMAVLCMTVAPVGRSAGGLAQVAALSVVLLLALWPAVRDRRTTRSDNRSAEPV